MHLSAGPPACEFPCLHWGRPSRPPALADQVQACSRRRQPHRRSAWPGQTRAHATAAILRAPIFVGLPCDTTCIAPHSVPPSLREPPHCCHCTGAPLLLPLIAWICYALWTRSRTPHHPSQPLPPSHHIPDPPGRSCPPLTARWLGPVLFRLFGSISPIPAVAFRRKWPWLSLMPPGPLCAVHGMCAEFTGKPRH